MNISQFFKKDLQDNSQREYAEDVLRNKLEEDPDVMSSYISPLPSGYICETEPPTEDTMILNIKNDGKDIYTVTFHYKVYDCHDALYIDDMARLEDIPKEERFASSILDGIAVMAEDCGYKNVGLHAAAAGNIEGALKQEDLEAWYERHLGKNSNRSFKFYYNDNDDDYKIGGLDDFIILLHNLS